MHSLHKNNNLGHVTFHWMEIVASVTSGVIVRTIQKVKVKDVQLVGKIKIYIYIKYKICLKCPLTVSNNMEWYMQMVNCIQLSTVVCMLIMLMINQLVFTLHYILYLNIKKVWSYTYFYFSPTIISAEPSLRGMRRLRLGG